MLKLHELPGDPGKTQKKKRIGRGEGSGQGKTSGKGHKGKQARAGSGKGPSFEGGQMPFLRRIPKFGFKNTSFRLRRAEVTLAQLETFESGTVVDFAALCARKLVSKQTEFVKVIATGTLTRKLTIKAQAFTAGARERIEAAGGSCETVAS